MPQVRPADMRKCHTQDMAYFENSGGIDTLRGLRIDFRRQLPRRPSEEKHLWRVE